MPKTKSILSIFLAPMILSTAMQSGVARDKPPSFTMDDMARTVSAWLSAPHADHSTRASRYWSSKQAVPESCAVCHSEPGFILSLSHDSVAAPVFEHPLAATAIGCATCHNSSAQTLESVSFPSGASKSGLGSSAVCSQCHKGRASGDDVRISTSLHAEDELLDAPRFISIHRGAAAATLGGSDVRGGYEYKGRSYAGAFRHVPSAGTCTACHDPHSTAVAEDACLSCHRGVTALRDIRTQHRDFDGDGDIAGGISTEIEGLQEQLLSAMKEYARQVSGTPLAYSPGQFPYFFEVSGHDKRAAADVGPAQEYRAWTPRLLRAAYNYQFANEDRGAYVHNPRYVLQLLHDSLVDLSEKIPLEIRGRPRPS